MNISFNGNVHTVNLKDTRKMNLENQVCSLELSKRLKELGVKQSSLFFWTSGGVTSRLESLPILESNYSAFTVAELGEILPVGIWNPKKCKSIYLHCEPANRICYWLIRYGNDLYQEELTEANARAKMLIYLLENKLMELPNA